MTKVLLTTVCRPFGPEYGDSDSVGYELLHEQVTRAQGLFSPRSLHVHFSLEYIAENLDAQTTVLQYPSAEELEAELLKGYDVVGLSFVLATFHKMKDASALIRRVAPDAKIVLGGYGTVATDEALKPYGDHICREEGVAYMRELLGEPPAPLPYRHPMIVTQMRVFGREASRTGIVLAGLGCPNGCDFCCTSHFFSRKHIRLLPTGADIHRVAERYHEIDPSMSLLILDEDFLLNRKRAMEFRECVMKAGKPLSIFAFASIRALSQYQIPELLEMGIDGLWIGYEGTRSGYGKQTGRPVDELFADLRRHGVSVLASMIVGFPYQTPEIVAEEFDGLMRLSPVLTQFLIYGPCPGTPFYERVIKEGLLNADVAADSALFFRRETGFHSMVRHPAMQGADIEALQRRCFKNDFERLGPSIHRSVRRWFSGYLTLRKSSSEFLRKKAEKFLQDVRHARPIFLAGRLFGPNATVRRKIKTLERRVAVALGPPTLRERVEALFAVAAAAWTSLTLRLKLFRHPNVVRTEYRAPVVPGGAWRRVVAESARHRVDVELRRLSTVWVRVTGSFDNTEAARLVERIKAGLARGRERLVLDFARLTEAEAQTAKRIAEGLSAFRDRIRVILPPFADGGFGDPILKPYECGTP